jgi:hypothetical protein
MDDPHGKRDDLERRPESPGDAAPWLAELLSLVESKGVQVDELLAQLESFQERIPAPPAEELAAILAGRPLSLEAHAIALLQRSIMTFENGIWDLRTGLEEESLAQLPDRKPSLLEVNALLSGLPKRGES